MRLRQDTSRRESVFPWGDAPAAPSYAVGDAIYSGTCRGTVVSVDAEHNTMAVAWSDNEDGGAINYPIEASYLRREFPWEM